MSEINKDQKVLEEGRKEPLKGVEAPLRDLIVKKLFKRCTELDLGKEVVSLWTRGSANRQTWLERQAEYLHNWDEHLIESTEGAFDGSSKLHIPVSLMVCKTMHARFLQAVWQEPPCHVKAENEASTERVAVVQDTMKYALTKWCNHYRGARRVVDQWVWDWITMGSGILKMKWDVSYTRFVDVVKEPVTSLKIVKGPDGSELTVPVQGVKEKEEVKTKKCFDGPVFSLVNLEDLLIIGGGGDPDLADAVIEIDYLTASQLWTLSDRGIFDEDAVKSVIEAGPDRMEGEASAQLKIQRKDHAGQTQLDTDLDLDRYAILEAHIKKDIDGSGINSDLIVWVHKSTGELLRATYLYRVSPDGSRPYAKVDFHLRKDQEYGVGMVELLYPLAKEMDAIHNMRVDFGLISVMPFGFYRANSGIDPKTIQLEPGALIPVENPQTDVFFPNLGNRTTFGLQEEQGIQQMVERLSSVSDINMGVINGQGATRTATGSRMLNNEMTANLDVYLGRLNEGWKKALRSLFHMLQLRMPAGLSFRLTGDDGRDYWRSVKDSTELAGDFDFEVSPNSASSNPGIEQEKAQQILSITSNPLNIQLGVVTAMQHYEAIKNFLQALGVRDYGRFLNKPQGMARTLTPEEEANRVLRGMDVPITPEMDHEGFLAFYKHIHDEDELLGQFTPEQAMQLARQAKLHERMMAALQQMQAQAANARQMQLNAQMGAQQAPVATPPAPMGGGSPVQPMVAPGAFLPGAGG
jgi:hypothetical protein